MCTRLPQHSQIQNENRSEMKWRHQNEHGKQLNIVTGATRMAAHVFSDVNTFTYPATPPLSMWFASVTSSLQTSNCHFLIDNINYTKWLHIIWLRIIHILYTDPKMLYECVCVRVYTVHAPLCHCGPRVYSRTPHTSHRHFRTIHN